MAKHRSPCLQLALEIAIDIFVIQLQNISGELNMKSIDFAKLALNENVFLTIPDISTQGVVMEIPIDDRHLGILDPSKTRFQFLIRIDKNFL